MICHFSALFWFDVNRSGDDGNNPVNLVLFQLVARALKLSHPVVDLRPAKANRILLEATPKIIDATMYLAATILDLIPIPGHIPIP